MTAEGLPLADLDLKRLALLLKKHNQAVPFEEPTVSINVITATFCGLLDLKYITFF